MIAAMMPARHMPAIAGWKNCVDMRMNTFSLSAPVSVVVSGRHISSIQPIDSAVSPGEVLVEGEGGR